MRGEGSKERQREGEEGMEEGFCGFHHIPHIAACIICARRFVSARPPLLDASPSPTLLHSARIRTHGTCSVTTPPPTPLPPPFSYLSLHSATPPFHSFLQGGFVRDTLFKVLDGEPGVVLKEGVPTNEGRRATR